MELLEFKHENDPARNRELFGLLGEYATSSATRDKLGGVISSEPGRLWFIMTEKGETRRVMASDRYVWGGRGPLFSICTHWRKGRTFQCWNIVLKVPGKTAQHI